MTASPIQYPTEDRGQSAPVKVEFSLDQLEAVCLANFLAMTSALAIEAVVSVNRSLLDPMIQAEKMATFSAVCEASAALDAVGHGPQRRIIEHVAMQVAP